MFLVFMTVKDGRVVTSISLRNNTKVTAIGLVCLFGTECLMGIQGLLMLNKGMSGCVVDKESRALEHLSLVSFSISTIGPSRYR